jgi:hypothetical protein
MPKVRIVAISDTHGQHEKMRVPDGDIFVHAGDFMLTGSKVREIAQFNEWLGTLPHRWKIVVGGNHDMILEGTGFGMMLRNAVYLENARCEIYGLKFWGSPYTPEYNGWGFMLPRGERIRRIWRGIPANTDVLITHGPPWGILDAIEGSSVGDVDLLEELAHRPIPLHIFGHIHPGYGYRALDGRHFYNVAALDENKEPTHAPVVIDVEAPDGFMALPPKEWR